MFVYDGLFSFLYKSRPSQNKISAPGIREIPVTDPADVPPAQGELSDDSVGLGVIPSDFIDSQYIELAQSQAAAAPAPAPIPAPAP